jgi:glycosyltransferase involved in cell wall biosynthesis
VPCYNEEQVLPLLRQRLTAALQAVDAEWRVLLVDDGSRDATPEILRRFHSEDERFVAVGLSRNFGHQAALSAGLRFSDRKSDLLFVLDADLQDPPELIADCLRLWRDGADVVYAVRTERKEGLLLRISYSLFYRTLRRLASTEVPLDAGDFCLMDRRVVEVLRRMPEQNPFIRGMRAWSGFDQRPLVYERGSRAAGRTKYPSRRLVKLAVDGLISNSAAPLRAATYLGFSIVLASLLGLLFVLTWRLLGFTFMGHSAAAIPGWAGIMAASFLLGGVQLLVLGVMGEYVARIFDDVRGRPRWIIDWSEGVSLEESVRRD